MQISWIPNFNLNHGCTDTIIVADTNTCYSADTDTYKSPIIRDSVTDTPIFRICLLVSRKCHALKKNLKIILHIHWASIVDTKIKLFTKIKYQRVFFHEFNLRIRYLSLILMMFRIGECK